MRVCVCPLYWLHIEYQDTRSTSKERTFLLSGSIFACPHNFTGLFARHAFEVEITTGLRLKSGLGVVG